MAEKRWRSQRFRDLAFELGELGQEAAKDAAILADLRALRRYLGDVVMQAEADSPVVAERKRRGRISYLESELTRLRADGHG